MKKVLPIFAVSLLWTAPVAAGEIEPTDNGLVRVKSAFSVEQTAERFATLIQDKGLKLFTKIDHAAGAQSVGQSLPPTQLLLFGNPKVGTPLMACSRSVAIDLPQKALIWEDQAGQVWVGYNNPKYLMERHKLTGCEPVLAKVENVLRSLATSAAQPVESKASQPLSQSSPRKDYHD